MVDFIVAFFKGSVKPQSHPRRYCDRPFIPNSISDVLDANLAAGRLVWSL